MSGNKMCFNLLGLHVHLHALQLLQKVFLGSSGRMDYKINPAIIGYYNSPEFGNH